MATKRVKKNEVYGLQPFTDVFPVPVIAKRAPTTRDMAELGTCWVDKSGEDVYFLVNVAANSATWINSGGGGGSFNTLDVTTTATIGTTLTLSSLTAGTMRTSAAGVVSTLADGADGEVLIGTTGGAPAWATLTAGGGITITEAAGTITITNPGATGTTFGTDAGGPVSPTGGGLTTFEGYDANITTDGATANTVKIRLADAITSVGKITSSVDFEVATGTTVINSDTNAAQAIYLHADGGVNETIEITSTQGTAVDAVAIESTAGGISMVTGDVSNSSMSFDSAGGILLDADAGDAVLISAGADVVVGSATGSTLLSTNVNDHDTILGSSSATHDLKIYSGTDGTAMSSTGATTIDAAGVLELNSSAGIISVGNDAVAQNINVGTGAAARTISIGNSTGATAVDVDCGTGGITLGTNATAHTTTVGSTNTTCDTTIQTGTGAMTFTAGGVFDVNATGNVTIDSSGGTLGIGEGADANNINIGTGAAARTVTIGNGTGATSVVLNSGTGNLDLGINATDHTTRLGSTSGTSATTIQAGTGAMTFTAGGAFDANVTGNATIDAATTTITSTSDAAQAIYLHANTGTSETIDIVNTQGTNAAAVAITSTAGGVTVTADTATGIVLDADGSTSIVGDTGTAAAAAITLNKRVGVATLTGLTTASAASQRYTITNSVCQATSGLLVTVANKSAGNDCKIQMDACTPGAGSFTVDTTNVGTQALDSDVIITWIIIN